MRSRCLVRLVLVASLAAFAVLGARPPTVLAHASLRAATPAPGERLRAPPDRIVLSFTEPLNPGLSEARVYSGSSRRPLAAGQRVVDGRRLVLIPRSPLSRGTYRVQWRSVSTDDGHALEGSFGFGVRVAATGAASVQESPLARGGWVRTPVRAALYFALLLFAGGLLVQALIGRPGESWLVPAGMRSRSREIGIDPAAAAARARSLTDDVGVFTLGLAVLAAGVEAFAAARHISAVALADFLLTPPAGPARIGVVAAVAVGLALAGRRPRLAALAALAALACVAASGHADSAAPRAAALAADLVHLVAGAVWLGGTVMIVAVWWPLLARGRSPARRALAVEVLPAFGSVAARAFAVVVVSGAVNAVIELGRVAALWQTAYGAVLLVKIALVAAAAAAGYVHARRLRPRLVGANPHPGRRVEQAHWTLLRTEPLLAAAIVLAAAVLVTFPLPPRQLEASSARASAVAACEPCPLPSPSHGELSVADLGGSQVVAGYLRRRGEGLAATVRLIDYRGRPAPGPARVAGATASGCGAGCFEFRLTTAPARLAVSVRQGSRWYAVNLPARWAPGQSARARSLLLRAQRTMRRLTAVRELERVTSGPGTLAATDYRLRAPDRLAYSTATGVQAVQIGRRQWLRVPGFPWRRHDDLDGGVAFSTRSWFSWTPYAQAVELLAPEGDGAAGVVEVALMDPGTPVWTRLWIDTRRSRVLRERLVARSRLVTSRFVEFDRPVAIQAPPAGGRR
ncbi:MAG: CopD family protein [Solirubrobacteraceae bacterium]